MSIINIETLIMYMFIWQIICIKQNRYFMELICGIILPLGVGMRKHFLKSIALGSVAFLTLGCQNPSVISKPYNINTNPQGYVHRYDDLDKEGLELNVIVSEMADQLEKYKVDRGNDLPTLAVITFVDVHSYKTPSDLGRMISESFIHEMHRRGEAVIDHHLTGYVEVTPTGDIVLSRDAEQLARKLAVSRFLIGTLSRNNVGTVVNARIVSLKNNMVESTAVGIIPSALYPPPKPVIVKINPNNSKMSGSLIVREDPAMVETKTVYKQE